jgi:hypothetical protein
MPVAPAISHAHHLTIGQANAFAGGINNVLGQYNQSQLINQLLNRSSY